MGMVSMGWIAVRGKEAKGGRKAGRKGRGIRKRR